MPSSSDPAGPVPVFTTSDKSLLLVVKSVLEAAGIPYAVQGESVMRLLPLGSFGTGMFRPVLGATILVPQERAEEARDLLQSYEGKEGGCSGSSADPLDPSDDPAEPTDDPTEPSDDQTAPTDDSADPPEGPAVQSNDPASLPGDRADD